jgi:hypothetical protein
MTMEAAVKEVEYQLRVAANTPKGEMAIRKVHVNKVLHSQKAKKTLGRKRHPKANPYLKILTETWKTQKLPADPRVGWMDQLACMRLAWGHDSAGSLE